MGAKLWDIFNSNPNPFTLKKGTLVAVNTGSLIAKYNVNIKQSRPKQVGILLSNAFTYEDLEEFKDSVSRSSNIYYKKMYKIFICGIIMTIYREDIHEVL